MADAMGTRSGVTTEPIKSHRILLADSANSWGIASLMPLKNVDIISYEGNQGMASYTAFWAWVNKHSRKVRSCKYAVCCTEDVAQRLCVSFYKGRIYLAVQTLYRCYYDALNTLISSHQNPSPGGLDSVLRLEFHLGYPIFF